MSGACRRRLWHCHRGAGGDDIRHRKATASTELVGRRDLGPTTRTGVGRHLLRLCLDLSDLGTNLTALDITLRDAVIEGLPPGTQLRIILGDIIEACTKLRPSRRLLISFSWELSFIVLVERPTAAFASLKESLRSSRNPIIISLA